MKKQSGGGNYPYRYFHANAVPFKPCQCQNNKQEGGAIRMPYRYFHPNATPFQPCNSCGAVRDPVYYNDFVRNQGCQGYNSCNMTGGARKQTGGFPVGAPFTYFTEGKPLKYNYSMKDTYSGTPTFDHVGANHFWH